MIIRQDVREPEIQLLADVNNTGIKFLREFMKVGDYQYGNILVERKQIDDFASSIFDKRIETQVEKMKESGKDCFIVIVGNLKDRKTEIHENCILGKIVSLVYKHNMKLIQCENEFQFLYVLKNICEKVGDKNGK